MLERIIDGALCIYLRAYPLLLLLLLLSLGISLGAYPQSDQRFIDS